VAKDLSARNKYGENALHLAAQKGYIYYVGELIKTRGYVNGKDNLGYMALHNSADGEGFDDVKALIGGRAIVDEKTD
jgi:ankyrin repeat protein